MFLSGWETDGSVYEQINDWDLKQPGEQEEETGLLCCPFFVYVCMYMEQG